MKALVFSLIVGFILTFGCSKDDNPATPPNHAPSITRVTASPDSMGLAVSTTVNCVATDADRDTLTYAWSCPRGSFPNGATSASVVWQAPILVGNYTIYVVVSDGAETANGSATVNVRTPATGSISGRVTDRTNGNAIAGVTITTQPATSSISTNSEGHYTLSDVQPANYVVNASKAGYLGSSVQVAVTSGDTATADIALLVSQGGHAGEEREFPMGTTTIRMCWIPAGSFNMGSPVHEQDREGDEGPVHQVTFSQGFWLGKYEITQTQWQAVMGSNPSNFHGDSLPVDNVSWEDIQEFESALGGAFSLPSESEWEYACRALTTTRFYWGDDAVYSLIGAYAWYSENSNRTTHRVGTKTANAWGLCDMTGNVWEWCEDWYHLDYTGAPNDGSAWVADGGTYGVVMRGGSWYHVDLTCRSAGRAGFNDPNIGSTSAGFRVVASFLRP